MILEILTIILIIAGIKHYFSDKSENELLSIFSEDEKKFLRPDWKEFKKYLDDVGIEKFYHFTDRANLQSIRENNGLYSRYRMLKNGIKPLRYGSNDTSDKIEFRKNLHYYVHLTPTNTHPMLHVAKQRGSIQDPVLLEIDPRIIFLNYSYFTNINATDTNAIVGKKLYNLKSINFDLIKSGRWSGENEKKQYQAEILIKGVLPSKFIKNLGNL